MAIYRWSEAKTVGNYIYHFYDYVKTLPTQEAFKLLNDYESGADDPRNADL
jgi:hypothetical protein